MGQLTKTRVHEKKYVNASPPNQFITVPNWPASFTTPKINFRPSLRVQVIINRKTATGSEIEMFIKLPFKLTVISEVAKYYHQTILEFSLWSLATGNTQKKAFILMGDALQSSFVLFHWGSFSGWLKPFFWFFISCISTTSYKLNDSLGLLNVFLHIFLSIVNPD